MRILDFIFPSTCVFCNTFGSLVCDDCQRHIQKIESSYCSVCGKPFASNIKPHPCSQCESKKNSYDKHRSLFIFNDSIKKLIHGFKYDAEFANKKFFKKFMSVCKNDFLDVDLIVPIPLYKTRLKKRGFNQSLLLARLWGECLGCKVNDKILTRIKDTKSQTGLDKQARQKNLQNAFKVADSFMLQKYKKILVVDDVHTTGVTLNVAAKELKKAGAKTVYATTLAFVNC